MIYYTGDIHGNHEIRPWNIPTYKTKVWHGDTVWYCGHWHFNKRIDKMHFIFHDFETNE